MPDRLNPPPSGATNKRAQQPYGPEVVNVLSEAAQQRIIQAYAAGVSIRGIAATFHHSKVTVRQVLRASGAETRGGASLAKVSTEQLQEQHAAGWTPRQIADAAGADIRTIHERMGRLGLPVAKRPMPGPAADIAAAYEAGQSLRSLAAEFDSSRPVIRRAIAGAGVTIRSTSEPLVSPLKLADMCRRGQTVAQMSAATGVSRRTLRTYLSEAGLQAGDNRPGRQKPAPAKHGKETNIDTMDHHGDGAGLLPAFEALSLEDAGAAVDQLRAVLASLPENPASVADRMLRARLEAFVAGYEVGSSGTRS